MSSAEGSAQARRFRAVNWTVLGTGVSRALGFTTTLVLGRLLVPEDFGLVALATVVTAFIGILSEQGFSSTLVQRRDIGRDGQRTILGLAIATGLAGAALTVALAPLAAIAFDEERVTELIVFLAIGVPLGTTGQFHWGLLWRRQQFKRMFGVQVVQAAVYLSVAVALAVLDAGAWSIVVGSVAGNATRLALLVGLAPYHVRPALDRGMARTVFATSSGFLVLTLLSFAQGAIDRAAIGNLLGTTAVGTFFLGQRLAELAYLAIAIPVAQVLFSEFSRRRAEGQDIRRPYLEALQLVALVGCPLSFVTGGAAKPVVEALLGHRWDRLIEPLSVLGLWGSIGVVLTTSTWYLNSLGLQHLAALRWAIVMVVTVPAVFLAASAGTVVTVCWVITGRAVLSVGTLWVISGGRSGVPARRHVQAVWPIAVGGALGWLAARGLAVGLDEHLPPGLLAPLAVLGGLAAYTAGVHLSNRRLIPDAIVRFRLLLPARR